MSRPAHTLGLSPACTPLLLLCHPTVAPRCRLLALPLPRLKIAGSRWRHRSVVLVVGRNYPWSESGPTNDRRFCRSGKYWRPPRPRMPRCINNTWFHGRAQAWFSCRDHIRTPDALNGWKSAIPVSIPYRFYPGHCKRCKISTGTISIRVRKRFCR